jgi:hypothetical protein
MKVKTLLEHSNPHGDKALKAVGTEYEIPDAEGRTLVDDKIVQDVTPKAEKAAAAADEK